MQKHTLLDATTSAEDSRSIQCTTNRPEIHFTCPGIADGDGEAVVQYYDGTTWRDYYVEGVKQTITMTSGSENTGRVVQSYGTYRVSKPATVASVPVHATAAK